MVFIFIYDEVFFTHRHKVSFREVILVQMKFQVHIQGEMIELTLNGEKTTCMMTLQYNF